MRNVRTVLAALLLALPAAALELDEAFIEGRLAYFNPTQSPDTFDANFDGGQGLVLGAGGAWKFGNGLYVEGALDYYTKDGNKVYLGGGQTIDSGFSTDISIMPITATAGWSFLKDAAWSPMVGAGIGYYLVDVSDGDADNAFGYHILAGAEFLKDRKFGLAAELKLSSAPDALGHGGTSQFYDEDDVGGITFTIKGLYRYRH